MYLSSIYSEPAGLFPRVRFVNGVNVIYGKKEKDTDPKDSLNSIGKSTFLDLIDFCLLASYKKPHNPRLVAAHDILSGYKIVLEFEIEDKKYIIKRSVDEPLVAEFSQDKTIERFDIESLKSYLGRLIFERKNYDGHFNPKWFRSLITFYTKIQKFRREQYLDPIKYVKEFSELEINIYQFYLLGLNNNHLLENLKHYVEYKKIVPALKQVRTLIAEKYDLTNIKQTNETISKLRLEIVRLDSAIQRFELLEQYKNSEEEANKLTSRIKDLWLLNYNDKKKIDSYEESFKIKDKISTTKIKNIYSQLSDDFAVKVKKTLDQAVKFREKLAESRRLFLSNEIESASSKIKEREVFIKELEEERAKIFGFLAAQDAIKDFTEAYSIINLKRSQLADLESNVTVINELDYEKNQIENEIAKVKLDIINQVNDINLVSKNITKLYALFMEVYNRIYTHHVNESNFSITHNSRKEKVAEINISMPDMFGKGKNQGRTLVYDLFVLLLNLNSEQNFPKFLIHDGIFDGVDKSHFVSVIQFIQELANSGEKIQYITTINEEGTLSEKFGVSEMIDGLNSIEDESILVLSNKNKLFGRDFDNVYN